MKGPLMSDNWWDGPMLAFDLETTGVKVETDRIVTAHIGNNDYLCNPGIPIPAEATNIHGISDGDAVYGSKPSKVLSDIHHYLLTATDEGIPIVGFNLAFDFTLLDREFRRHTPRLRLPFGMLAVDGYVLDKHVDKWRSGSRTLVNVATHWGVTLDNAHTASADAYAAVDIVRAIGRKHGTAQATAVEPALTTDLNRLQFDQQQWRSEQCQSLEQYLRRKNPSIVIDPDWPVIPIWKTTN